MGKFGIGKFDEAVFDYPVTIELNGTPINKAVLVNGFSIEQSKDSNPSSCQFTCVKWGAHGVIPDLADEITVWDRGEKIFAGTIIEIEETVKGRDALYYQVRCKDYTNVLDQLLWTSSYDNQTYKQIVDDFVANHAPSEITGNNVSSDASAYEINFIQFNYTRPTNALKTLADKIGFEFWVDYDKDLHFVPQGTSDAPFDLTDTNGKYIYRSLKLQKSDSQIKNDIVVRAGDQVGAEITDDKVGTGDGVQKRFDISYKFDETPTVKVDGTTQSVGTDFLDDSSSYDVLWNYQEKVLNFSSAPSDGASITVSGKPLIPILIKYTDPASINSKGRFQARITDKNIKTEDGARQRAKQELDLYAKSSYHGTFRTYEKGLARGQKIRIQSSIRSIDRYFVIEKVLIKPFTNSVMQYEVEVDTIKSYKMADLFRDLLNQEERTVKNIRQEREVLQIVISLINIDGVDVSETLSINKNIISLNDGVSVGDSLLRMALNDPPTWVASPYAPTGDLDRKRTPYADRGALLAK